MAQIESLPPKRMRLSGAARAEAISQLVQRHSKLTPDEGELLREVFRDVIYVHHDAVWDRLRRRGLKQDEAKDLVQESMKTLYEHVLENGFPYQIPEMLQAITTGKLLNFVRRWRRCPESIGLPSSGSLEPRSGPDLDRAMDLREIGRKVFPLLSFDHQQVLTAVVINGLSHVAAAELLEIPEGTLKSRLLAAKKALVALVTPLLPESQRGV